MEVLKRFEEENAQDEEGLQSDEEDGGDDLAQRLNDMDISEYGVWVVRVVLMIF